ncbi:MAG TPA: CoA transferase, partial [Dehalococcoidia bacterium]
MSGITAIDLTDESGVFASRILADLGADVIRVEPPDGGAFRLRAPFLGKSPDIEKSFHHLYHNANKRSLVLDLNEGADGGVMARLVESAHMLLYSGTELPAGLDESRIRAANARIILVAISPYGRTGPYSRRSANDLTAAAAGGLIQVSGRPDQTPVQAAADQSYKMAGLIAATGAMLALTGQEVQGMAGGTLDVSLQEAVMAALIQTSNANRYLWHGRVPKRPGLGGNVVRCADDRWITINIRPDRFGEFLAWVRAEGLETDLTEADWAQAGAESRTPAVDSLIRALAAKYDRESYFEKAWSLGVLGLPVQTFADFASCEHFAFTQQFIDVADTGRGVKLSYPRSPVADATAVQIRPAPRLGEHSAEIRAQLDKRRTLSEAPAPFDPRELLGGIRVLDFTIALAGPLTTRTFANFGAEVITVESATRPVNPRVSVRPPGYADLNLGGIHNVAGTGKLSITLDLSQAEALPIVENLVRQSDIIANNFRPGVMDKLGLGYERVRELKPDAIYLSMPGCASSGPWRDRGTLGPMLAGASGLNALTGFPDQPPYGIGVAYPDFVAP